MEKDVLTRFGVSMPDELVKQFDRYITEQGYTNRSEAIRDLVRRVLLEPSALQGTQAVAGTIVMVYDHHMTDLPLVLMELQHDYHHDIISTMHVHLNHDQCMEVIVVRGVLSRLRELHQRIQVQKGVLYAELSVTYADGRGTTAPGDHGHVHSSSKGKMGESRRPL
ncbi:MULTISPECIES: nickel-responsive transcriptional regulator NikR [Paenibacillus]|uniref:nickel-responsive transcriptional regulator NikR n=1 Tax=Paenibacillus TaxID=44249 RepID=UPI0022B8C6B0|nr:nickel-responsive transcriptional regulator NikR [Paenibacillus caseinilyticus]MCZ8519967.1 nickel-responsive transcriptional regulator NikR [Paenibacillus caseinilyticus]